MKNIILILLLLLSTTGSPAQIPKRYDTENYKRAMEAIDKGNYDTAAEHLDLRTHLTVTISIVKGYD